VDTKTKTTRLPASTSSDSLKLYGRVVGDEMSASGESELKIGGFMYSQRIIYCSSGQKIDLPPTL
jgi:hypothetical protein